MSSDDFMATMATVFGGVIFFSAIGDWVYRDTGAVVGAVTGLAVGVGLRMLDARLRK